MGFESSIVERLFFAELGQELLVDPAEISLTGYLESLDRAGEV
jgi:hypothetical protein